MLGFINIYKLVFMIFHVAHIYIYLYWIAQFRPFLLRGACCGL